MNYSFRMQTGIKNVFVTNSNTDYRTPRFADDGNEMDFKVMLNME